MNRIFFSNQKIFVISLSLFLLTCLRSQAQWSQLNGPEGGSITDLLLDGTDLYAVTANGGVYKSGDGAANWSLVGSDIVGDDANTIVKSGSNIVVGSSTGPYLSSNSGADWAYSASGLVSSDVLQLVLDGTDIYAGTPEGVYISSDNGGSWSGLGTSDLSDEVSSVAVDGTDIWAAVSEDAASPGLYMSANSGTNWSEVTNVGFTDAGVNFVYVSGSNLLVQNSSGEGIKYTSDGGTSWNDATGIPDIVATISENGGTLYAGTNGGGIYTSTDDGASWSQFSTSGLDNDLVSRLLFDGTTWYAGTGGGVYKSTDSGSNWTEMVSGMKAHAVSALLTDGSDIYAGTSGGGVYKSSDDGSNWLKVNSGITGKNFLVFSLLKSGSDIYAGTFGGVVKTSDGGSSWTQKNNGLSITFGISSMTATSTNIFAMDLLAAIYTSSDGGDNWSLAMGSTGTEFVGLPWSIGSDGTNIYGSGFFGEVVLKSTDNGTNWASSSTGITNSGFNLTYQFFYDGASVYAATAEGMFRSDDNGSSWNNADTGISGQLINDFAMDGSNIYAGSDNGGVFVTSNQGDSWTTANTDLGNLRVGSLAAGSLYAGTTGSSVWSYSPPPVGPPDQPAEVTFSSPTATSVTVNWVEPFDNGSAITGYSLEQKEEGGSYAEVYSGTNTSYAATSLTTGTTYYFRVKATNAEGNSPFSNEADFIPQDVILMADGSTTACSGLFTDSGGLGGNYSNGEDLVFTISPENASDKVEVAFTSVDIEDGWDNLYVYDGPDTGSPLLETITGNSFSGTITSTATDGELTFNFVSDGSETRAGWEAMVSCVSPGASVPDQPAAPTFGTITSSSIVVNWTAPNDNGSTITSYTLEQKEGSGGTFSEIFTGNALTHTATSLNPGTEYFFRVLATNGEGDSPFSSEAGETSLSALNPFITTWQSDNTGTSGNNQITIPTSGSGYNYDISWEEVGNPGNNGVEPSGQTGDYTITFPSPGTYQISISGDFPRIYFNYSGDREKILTVEQWGDIAWTSMENAFYGCIHLTVPASDQPDLSAVTSMASMFASAESFNQDIGSWNVGNIMNMDALFSGATIFNQDISNWDVSSVNSMKYMFQNARAFNLPIGDWDVSNVTTMEGMFRDGSGGTNSNFNQDIGNWEVGNVTDMLAMFEGAGTFNQNINGWDVTSVTNMARMFGGASSFNQSLSNWVVSNVTVMANMFNGASAFNQNISAWSIGNVTTMSSMFNGAGVFNQDISGWDVSNVTDMKYMFNDASSFDQDLGDWDVSNVTDMFQMLSSSGLSIDSYDNTLIGWSGLLSLQSNVSLGAFQLEYCNGATARQSIIDDYNWNIGGDQIANTTWYEDSDGDGFGNSAISLSQCDQPVGYVSNNLDCDDTDENITEEIDWFADTDGDGYGNPSSTLNQCDQPAGYVTDNTDCDDNDPSKNPEAIWYEDSDGDGFGNSAISLSQCDQPIGYVSDNMDCDDTDIVRNPDLVWYADSDGDLYGDPNVTLNQCEQPPGYILNSDDCDDSDGTISPSTPWYRDFDGDGYGDQNVIVNQCQQPSGYVANSTDCNDQNDSIYLESTWFADADGDGFGDSMTTQSSCSQPTGFVSDDTDCDDDDPDINPETVWFQDLDNDNYGNLNSTLIQCSQPSGYVADNTDCNDTDQNVYPGAPALADGKDNNCDGEVDKLSQEITFAAINDKIQGDSPFTLLATTNSGLAVDFTVVSGPVTISGNEVTITGAGVVMVKASQPGDSGYSPAADVEQSFCVNPPQPVISSSGLGTANVSLDIGETYPRRWYLDNTAMFGGTLQTGALTVTQEGTYSVETEVDGCLSVRSSDFTLIITDLSAGLDNALKMYPNPVSDYLNIVAPFDLSEKVDLRIIDANGVILKKTMLKPGWNSLDMQPYSQGLYLLQIEYENKISNHRIKKN